MKVQKILFVTEYHWEGELIPPTKADTRINTCGDSLDVGEMKRTGSPVVAFKS